MILIYYLLFNYPLYILLLFLYFIYFLFLYNLFYLQYIIIKTIIYNISFHFIIIKIIFILLIPFNNEFFFNINLHYKNNNKYSFIAYYNNIINIVLFPIMIYKNNNKL